MDASSDPCCTSLADDDDVGGGVTGRLVVARTGSLLGVDVAATDADDAAGIELADLSGESFPPPLTPAIFVD